MGSVVCTTRQLLACLSGESRSQLTQIHEVTDLLDTALQQAYEAWPEFTVPPESLARYLADRLPQLGTMQRALHNWHVADLYLCCACAAGNAQAIEVFYARYVPVIRSKLRRLRVAAPLSEDIEQALLDQLLVGDEQRLPMISRYLGSGRLNSWLHVVVTRTAHRALQRERGAVPVDDARLAQQVVGSSGSFELDKAKQAYRNAFKKAFKKALAGLSPREEAVLRHRFVDGLGLEHIGAIYRVHHSTVHRWLKGIRDTLIRETEAILMHELHVDHGECRSIMRLIQTDFDMTLHTFLNDPDSLA